MLHEKDKKTLKWLSASVLFKNTLIGDTPDFDAEKAKARLFARLQLTTHTESSQRRTMPFPTLGALKAVTETEIEP